MQFWANEDYRYMRPLQNKNCMIKSQGQVIEKYMGRHWGRGIILLIYESISVSERRMVVIKNGDRGRHDD